MRASTPFSDRLNSPRLPLFGPPLAPRLLRRRLYLQAITTENVSQVTATLRRRRPRRPRPLPYSEIYASPSRPTRNWEGAISTELMQAILILAIEFQRAWRKFDSLC